MRDLLAYAIITLGVAFIAIGVFGLYRFKNFYQRMLIGSKIDTVGYLTVLFGVMVKNGFNGFTLKVLLLVVLMLVINPIGSHLVARSAFKSGYRIDQDR